MDYEDAPPWRGDNTVRSTPRRLMALRPTTIRFAPDAMELVQEAASALGISVAQFVREAALMRACVTPGIREEMVEMSERIARLSRPVDGE